MLRLSQCLLRRGCSAVCGSWETCGRLSGRSLSGPPGPRTPTDTATVLAIYLFPRDLWDLSSPAGVEPGRLAVKTPSPNHWTTRELLVVGFLKHSS